MAEKLEAAPKVLIVSKRSTASPLWAFSLRQEQWNIVLETNPEAALLRWEKEIPDLILLDVNLTRGAITFSASSIRQELFHLSEAGTHRTCARCKCRFGQCEPPALRRAN